VYKIRLLALLSSRANEPSSSVDPTPGTFQMLNRPGIFQVFNNADASETFPADQRKEEEELRLKYLKMLRRCLQKQKRIQNK